MLLKLWQSRFPIVASPSDSIRRQGRTDHLWAWIVVGACSGTLSAVAAAVLDTRYLLYGALGIGLVALLPYLVMCAGSAERLLWAVLVLSLQFELSFTPIAGAPGKVAGPYGTMISATLLTALALLAIWVTMSTWAGGERLRPDPSLLLSAGAVLCTAIFSLVSEPAGRLLSSFGLFEILSLTLVAVAANHACSFRRNISILRSALFVALFIQSALIIIEQVLGVQISLARGLSTTYGWGGGDEGRFAGTFGAPSCAAAFLVVCLLFLFRRLTSKEPPSRAGVLWSLFAFGFLALLLTRTRSEWIGFTIACSGMGWQCYREGTLSRRTAKRFIIGGLLALLIAWPLVAQRLADDHKGAADTRENLVWIAMAMIKAHPFAGVGVNTATNQVYRYAASAGLDNNWVFIVHNQFLLVAAETGLPGLAAFIGLAWFGLRSAYRRTRSPDLLVKEVADAVFWSLVAMTWALNLDHVSGTMTYALFWFLIGAACGLGQIQEQEEALLRKPEHLKRQHLLLDGTKVTG